MEVAWIWYEKKEHKKTEQSKIYSSSSDLSLPAFSLHDSTSDGSETFSDLEKGNNASVTKQNKDENTILIISYYALFNDENYYIGGD